jgi:2-dehydro-3-deoxyphosphogluconate aldolase / (4S)-4-hydroxy-2-oxoglutarate aldolase
MVARVSVLWKSVGNGVESARKKEIAVNKDQIRARIEEIGIVPAVRVHSRDDAMFAATAVYHAGIPIAEITTTFPGAHEVIAALRKNLPEMIVGAGTVLDIDNAQKCIKAGAQFLTSPGLVLEVVECAKKQNLVAFPGALTPSEIIAAWNAGADFVKIFPCAPLGGEHYIQALKRPFSNIPLIASGGVNQQTAKGFLLAGAAALGIGAELIPNESIHRRQEDRIKELSRRFTKIVQDVRKRNLLQ